MAVVLINPFEVEPGTEEVFEAQWQKIADYLKEQPGFVNTKLHRSLAPGARFAFVNVAEWDSPQHFMAAVQSDGFKTLSSGSPTSFPALYQVVRTEGLVHAPLTEQGVSE